MRVVLWKNNRGLRGLWASNAMQQLINVSAGKRTAEGPYRCRGHWSSNVAASSPVTTTYIQDYYVVISLSPLSLTVSRLRMPRNLDVRRDALSWRLRRLSWPLLSLSTSCPAAAPSPAPSPAPAPAACWFRGLSSPTPAPSAAGSHVWSLRRTRHGRHMSIDTESPRRQNRPTSGRNNQPPTASPTRAAVVPKLLARKK